MSKRLFWYAKSGFEDDRAANQLQSTLLALAQAIANLEVKVGIVADSFKQSTSGGSEQYEVSWDELADATAKSSYQIGYDKDLVLAGTVSGDSTTDIYLPRARDYPRGRQLRVKITTAGATGTVTIYVHPSTSDKIDGTQTSVSVPVTTGMAWEDHPALIFESDGVRNWYHIGSLRRDVDDLLAIDGDQIQIDWNPTNYTPATTPSECDDVDDLTAHLYGIDQALASAVGSHLWTEFGAGAGALILNTTYALPAQYVDYQYINAGTSTDWTTGTAEE